MASTETALKELMTLRGATGVALVDYTSGMSLGAIGGGTINLEIAGAGNSEVIRSKIKVMQSLRYTSSLEDILISMDDQYHLLRLLKNHKNLFLYLVLKRNDANLALARHKLQEAEAYIEV